MKKSRIPTVRQAGLQKLLQLKRVDCLSIIRQLHEEGVVLLKALGVGEGGRGLDDRALDYCRSYVHHPQFRLHIYCLCPVWHSAGQTHLAPGEDAEGEGGLLAGLEGGGEQHVGLALQRAAVRHVPAVQ